MIFINFRRRNYDKVTLTQLSDLLFHVSDNTDLGEKMQEFLQVFTEKKIEILHSIIHCFLVDFCFGNRLLGP